MNDTLATPSQSAGPVTGADRIAYLDILRGFAVMAIFIVNIKGMGMPFAYYANGMGWETELEQHIAKVQKFLVDDKWRTIFTALYGAGLIMMYDRLKAKGLGRGVLFKRNTWLLIFGLIHLFLIWVGDILTSYALAGFLAILFVGMGRVGLLASGFALLFLGWLWASFMGAAPGFDAGLEAQLSPELWDVGSDVVAAEIAAFQGGFMDQLMARVSGAQGYILFYYLIMGNWLVTLGLMVMGMALFRLGFLTGAWGMIVSLLSVVIGLGGAWALDAWQLQYIAENGNTYGAASLMTPLAILDGWFGAFGYAALVTVLVRMGMTFGPVAAVGRMAFTNYITCSLIGTTLAGGHAFGLYGTFSLTTLMGIVVLTFIAMLIWSPLWLKAFRFGPLEWLWRSLVYGKFQPMTRG